MGTSTDTDGNYSLGTPSAQDTLVFSFIGYQTKQVPIGGQTTIDIEMQPQVLQGKEMVVVGYGTQETRDITGSITNINTTEETSKLPNYNIYQSLQGRVAGLNVGTPVGAGDSPNLLIRGPNSITASNNPLIVIDGIIYKGDINNFNPNDIVSVDVLKGPSATAVYGSRAANGVLVITTKAGEAGKPQFHFSTHAGIQNPVRLIYPLNGPDYIQKVLDYREQTGLSADPDNIAQYLTSVEAKNYSNNQTIDWMDQVIRTGVTNNYQLDVSGQSDNTNYYASGAYFNQKGIVENDNFRKITLNLNLTNHITDWFTISLRSNFITRGKKGRAASIPQAFRESPYGNLYDSTSTGVGGYAYYPVGDPLGENPLVETLVSSDVNHTAVWGLFSSKVNVPFIPGLQWTLNYSPNLRIRDQDSYIDNRIGNGITNNGIGSKSKLKNVDFSLDNIIHYRKTFAGIHSLYATLLYSREVETLHSSGLRGTDFFTQVLGYNNLGLAKNQTINSNYEKDRNVAYMARVNYSFKHKYALTLTSRRDGYSGFSEGHKYATFPSVAFAWTATNERFLDNISWLSYLKLRASYGKNGNQAVGRYQSLPTINSSENYVFGSQPITTLYESSMGNDKLTWETTTAKNIGVDFKIFRERITGNVDIYSSETKDLLLNRNLPETSGFASLLTNIGNVHNQGIEAAVHSINLKNGSFNWRSGITFSLNRNRIEQLTGQGDIIRDALFVGKPLGAFYGYKTNGIYQMNDDIPAAFQPGDFRIVDTDQNGEIGENDRMILGYNQPNYSFSISNTLSFKNLSFYILINSIQGGDGYYMGNANATLNPNAPFTTYTERFNIQDVPYWTPDRPSNKYPRINYNPPYPHPILEDRSFVRIQDVSLTYTFKKTTLKNLHLKGLKIYVSGKNLYTFTKWDGYDPQNSTNIGDFPLMRYFTAGFDVSF